MKSLDLLCTLGTVISWLTVNIQPILSIVASLVAIVVGVITVVLKIKTYLSDGKLTDEEIQDILNEIDRFTSS